MKSRNLSIIIPFYRGENFIKRCLENIYTNTTGNFEVIISSDGFDSRDFLFIYQRKI
jgi:glycosyltransferase involved in cell wall biosynthesis